MAETKTEMQIPKKVSFTVAECGEFHDMGEFHENIGTAKEALEIFKQIPEDRMNAIPTIGIRLTDAMQKDVIAEVDIANAKFIHLDMLEHVPEIMESKAAQFAIAELIHAMPEAKIQGDIPEEIQKKVTVVDIRESRKRSLRRLRIS